jgi:hypothetical protein
MFAPGIGEPSSQLPNDFDFMDFMNKPDDGYTQNNNSFSFFN